MARMLSGRHKSESLGLGYAGTPPLHCLQAFEAVARHLSLAKASGELRLSAAALGQSIAALEDRLGLKLLRSLTPAVELTEAGRRYFHAVQAFSHQLRDGLHEGFVLGRTQLRVPGFVAPVAGAPPASLRTASSEDRSHHHVDGQVRNGQGRRC
jgi:DNA-binding transcriptional LysR family regulator